MTTPDAQISWQTDLGPYVLGPIKPSVIIKTGTVNHFAHSDRVRHTAIASVALEFVMERHLRFYILPVRESQCIAFARPGRAIALQLDAVHAKIFEIERIFLVATREIGIANQANYD